MRNRRHTRRRKARHNTGRSTPCGVTRPAADSARDVDPDDHPLWERDEVGEDCTAIEFARTVGQALPAPRSVISWALAGQAEPHEAVIPREESLIWRACQAAFDNAEALWLARRAERAKRKSPGQRPELFPDQN
ncbi:hypothetical protein [uncultured Maricaulis sp.]|uniref:hypothetical protein n=1 Tax=uncultured Maricaulis sp. TaxID=174710 RepID=UPI00261F0F24|nr:hypothetical protein [uncultured Maricaulis sp.]